jgi:hypothetical protein
MKTEQYIAALVISTVVSVLIVAIVQHFSKGK